MFQEKWRVSHQLKKKSICQDIVTNVTFFFIYASETLIKLKNSRYLGKDVDNTLCFCFSFPGSSPNECYECFTHTSWEDCFNKTISRTCERGDYMCIKGKISFSKNSKTEHIFFKTCANGNECMTYEKDGTQVPTCQDKKRQGYSVECSVTCCEDDKCNGAVQGQRVSGLLMFVSCVLAAKKLIWS